MCLCGISSDFSLLSPSIRQVTHVLLTRPPLDNVSSGRSFPIRISFDLHVLGTPPAFILSQDQTLIKIIVCLKLILSLTDLLFFYCSVTITFVIVPCTLVRLVQFSKVFVALATTILVYHSQFSLSTGFFNFFYILFPSTMIHP